MTAGRYLAFLSMAAALAGSTAPLAASVRATAEQGRQWLLFAPTPRYPDAAHRQHITGSGLYKLRVIIKTGGVKKIIILRSTGNKNLDNSAVQTLTHWRF